MLQSYVVFANPALLGEVPTGESLGMNFGARYLSGDDITVGDAVLELPRRIHDMAWVDGSLDTTSLTQSGSDVIKGFLRYAMVVAGSCCRR